MKSGIFIILLFFLAACSPETEQTVENVTNTINKTSANVSGYETTDSEKNKTTVIEEQKTEDKTEQDESEAQKYDILDPSPNNSSVSSNLPAKKWIRGTTHIIEVIDVTENSDACIIRVDNSTDLIDVGETKTLNGVKIYVSDARIFNSVAEDKDVCELVIS